MSISKFPFGTIPPTSVCCGICQAHISLQDATFGPNRNNEEATFICASHIRDGHRFIISLADFVANERQEGNTACKAYILKSVR